MTGPKTDFHRQSQLEGPERWVFVLYEGRQTLAHVHHNAHASPLIG
jgi:hypothetical protein